MLGEQPAKGFASHGETWSFALALRLAVFSLLKREGTEPVLILDDVFAELDGKRRAALAELAAHAEQVLITAAVGADIPENLQATASIHTVTAVDSEDGRVSVLDAEVAHE